ncbi:hypothetical protein [Streptomyces sp. CS147]|uniref:effector-associated constant component EACC1 n=1 Tax=Streptomyces sp. CS147 TaxID=2162715 RepID=UPI001EF722E0|nr:hypothetical protein [Streptomyces sp. CS147]
MTVRAVGPSGAVEEQLRGWLLNEPELRGRVRRESTEPRPGTMGPATDALVALLEPGGVAAVFAGAIVAWVQTRRGNHSVTVTRPDGTSITISTRQARSLSPQELAELAERLARPELPPPPGNGQSGTERPPEDPAR